ncbi:MAG: glycosyltransferase family 4 protein [Candidatus Eisenbacteria bacterium]|uniref:Glycosyltransferase family 4 protein n=1 Tax=Eiseniibacteriota bacterium TaxID=2212470 RepID=A0A9D6LBG2_UNCEI|nr:glycosyltransferase family 4 protein [Candidatus Eisenbacteria bacterium]MBI3540505.1 glycosyltransferase family 4 protein [Candidatus Eisenbacteria bacterium]
MSAPHLLAINFRDMAHPEAGGAELHLEQILIAAVARGWRVTWLASGFPGGAAEAEHRGIRVVRRGSWWNFNLIVPGVLASEFASPAPDRIVEDINKAPCFTPWHTRAPVAVIVPHLFGATILREAALPVGLYVMALEALIPFVYRRSRFVAISESTRDDLVRRGVDASRITVVHCGLDHASYRADPAVARSADPTIVFVGRLRRYKGADWAMRALPRVLRQVPAARLLVIGDGPFEPALRREATRLGVAGAVDFLGFLPRADKVRRLQEAWVVVQPSPKEGWGLTVVEAGACGAAVVASDAPGLRDSVRRDETGLLVRYGDDAALADALARVLLDAPLRERLGRAGIAWAERFTWPACGEASLDALAGTASP